MTEPMQHQHYGITRKPALSARQNSDGKPHVKPGYKFIFGWHIHSLSNLSNIAPTG